MSPESGIVLVKLGGSLVTDKSRPFTARADRLERLAGEIARSGLAGRLIVGHGSGSFGHPTAAEHGIHLGVRTAEQVEGVAATQFQAHRLNRLVVEALWKAGAKPFSLAPSAMMAASAGVPGPIDLGPLTGALDLGLIPVVFGDVLMDSDQGASICSTEQAFETVVAALQEAGRRAERVIWLGITDGVLDRSGEPIPRIDAAAVGPILDTLEGAAGEDVTGGIRLRLESAARLAARGVPSWILNGTTPGGLEAALAGRPEGGTRVVS